MKVDCQAGIGLAGSALGGGPTVGKRYHAALEDSVEQHFPGNHCINCMCHSTENLYRWASLALQQAVGNAHMSFSLQTTSIMSSGKPAVWPGLLSAQCTCSCRHRVRAVRARASWRGHPMRP